jgi:glycerate kinase
VCHDRVVHVLLVAGDETVAQGLADAWTAASGRSVVEHLVLASRASRPGAGAPSGGVFVPTTALGLTRVPPPPVPADIAHLVERAAAADLVVVHVDVLDVDSLHEGRLADAARAAAPHAVPVVVLAGHSESTRREWSGAGVSGVHEVGQEPAAVAEAVGRAARTWVPGWA